MKEEIRLEINGRAVAAAKGETVLDAARAANIYVPTLCSDRRLAPYGGCRLCMVELVAGGRTRLVASCAYPAEEGLVVRTESERLGKVRRMVLDLLLPMAPTGPVEEMARRYGLKESRFTAGRSHCVLCGLCVRYRAEIKKANAIGFVGRGTEREVAFVPQVAPKVCDSCRECLALCPGGRIAMETDGINFPVPAWQRT